jgi:hypothetical protein
MRVFWKVDEEYEADDGYDDSNDPLPDENPLPPGMTLHPIHLLQPVCQHTPESSDRVADEVEEGVAFRYLTPQVPHGNKEQGGGEEAALESSEQHPQADERGPVLREAEADNNEAEGERDAGQEGAGPEFAGQHGGDGVEEDVEGEEDEDDDGVAVPR